MTKVCSSICTIYRMFVSEWRHGMKWWWIVLGRSTMIYIVILCAEFKIVDFYNFLNCNCNTQQFFQFGFPYNQINLGAINLLNILFKHSFLTWMRFVDSGATGSSNTICCWNILRPLTSITTDHHWLLSNFHHHHILPPSLRVQANSVILKTNSRWCKKEFRWQINCSCLFRQEKTHNWKKPR